MRLRTRCRATIGAPAGSTINTPFPTGPIAGTGVTGPDAGVQIAWTDSSWRLVAPESNVRDVFPLHATSLASATKLMADSPHPPTGFDIRVMRIPRIRWFETKPIE